MALFHRATITPTKADLIADWAPTQPWGPAASDAVDVIGSFRFDDPDGRVGMETHLVNAGGALFQVPLTYRDEPLDGAADALITEMEHSVLGTRWVYDGLRDPRFVLMLAAVTMTGQGEALGMAVYEDRWYIAPTNVRIQGGGWGMARVPIDGFELVSDDGDGDGCPATLRNERFELTVLRRPVPGPRPDIGLTATWDGQDHAVVLAEVREHLMKGITVPERTEDFTADPVELFFDLAYVIAFSQLVGVLVHEPTWEGVGKVFLLFGLLWLPWQQLTWTANAISGNGRGVRAIFLVATAVSVPMTASTSTALEDGGLPFAITLATLMGLGFVMQSLSAERGTGFRQAVVRWITPNVIAIVVLLGGTAVDGSARVAVWALALLVVFSAMLLAGGGEWVIRAGHFAERHSLIVIIALGEVIVAIGHPVFAALESENGIPGRTLIALGAAGAFAALIWWGYFDRPGPALEHRAETLPANERGRYARDVYTWAHAPIVIGIILSAAALEEITLHPSAALALPFRCMLIGGLGLLASGVVLAIRRAFGVVPKERLVGWTSIAALLLLASSWDGIVLLVLVDLVILTTLAVEHRRVEGPR